MSSLNVPADLFRPSLSSEPEPQTLHYNHPLKLLHRRLHAARETQEFISRRLKRDLYALTFLSPSIPSSPSHINHIEHDKCLSNRRYKLRRALVRSTNTEQTIIEIRANVKSKIQLHERWSTTADNNTRKQSIISAYDPDNDPSLDEAAAVEPWSPYHDSGQSIWLLNADNPGTPGYVYTSPTLIQRGTFLNSPTAHNPTIRPTTFSIPQPPEIAEGDYIIWSDSLGFVREDGSCHQMSTFKDDDRLEEVEEQIRTIVIHERDEDDGGMGDDDKRGKGRRGEVEFTGHGLMMNPRCASGPWFFGFGYDARERRIGYC